MDILPEIEARLGRAINPEADANQDKELMNPVLAHAPVPKL